MPTPEPWDPIHPDTLTSPELVEIIDLFGDIDWANQHAVEQRIADLAALNPEEI